MTFASEATITGVHWRRHHLTAHPMDTTSGTYVGTVEELQRQLSGGDSPRDAIRDGRCLTPPIGCGKPITGFSDDASVKEYGMTGMCQACQDALYNEEEDEAPTA